MGAWTSTLTLAVAVTLVVKVCRPCVVVTDEDGIDPLLLLELHSLPELCNKKQKQN